MAYASEHVFEADKAEFTLREQFRIKTNVSAIHHSLPPPKLKKNPMEADDTKSGEPMTNEEYERKILSDILVEKRRDNIYCLSSTDFQRILKQENESIFGSKEHRRRPSEDLGSDEEDFFEVVGDVDPKLLMTINEKFEAGLLAAEADAFWCFVKLLDGVLDYFTDMQPGVHQCIAKM